MNKPWTDTKSRKSYVEDCAIACNNNGRSLESWAAECINCTPDDILIEDGRIWVMGDEMEDDDVFALHCFLSGYEN